MENQAYANVTDAFVDSVKGNGYSVRVPSWCLPYLVNGKTEGYSNEEIKKMDSFVSRFEGELANGLNAGDYCVPMDGQEPSFSWWNDVDEYGAECFYFFLLSK